MLPNLSPPLFAPGQGFAAVESGLHFLTLHYTSISLKKAEKSGAGSIILAVYTDNVSPQDGHREG